MMTKTRSSALALLVIGWFFVARSPLPEYPGAFATTLVGAFKTEGDCNRERDALVAFVEQIGSASTVGRCAERSDI